MILDLPTLAIFLILLVACSGMLLAFSWLQTPSEPSLGIWALSYEGLAVALILIASRQHLSPAISIAVGNTVLMGVYGMFWNSARVFGGRPMTFWSLLGPLAWVGACNIPSFFASTDQRVIFASVDSAIFLALTAFEIWRAPGRLGNARKVTVGLTLFFATANLLRYPLAGALPFVGAYGPMQTFWFTVLTFLTLCYALAMAFLLVATARERFEEKQTREAQIDALTGAFNRGAFIDRAERILRRLGERGGNCALLLFDFDHFKAINDTYGHPVGDRVLVEFARLVIDRIRPTDFFGRLGGEEFALLLETSTDNALRVADRIRRDFAARRLAVSNGSVSATVSVGVAQYSSNETFVALFEAADAALYRAKALGRNNVAGEEAAPETGSPVSRPPADLLAIGPDWDWPQPVDGARRA